MLNSAQENYIREIYKLNWNSFNNKNNFTICKLLHYLIHNKLEKEDVSFIDLDNFQKAAISECLYYIDDLNTMLRDYYLRPSRRDPRLENFENYAHCLIKRIQSMHDLLESIHLNGDFHLFMINLCEFPDFIFHENPCSLESFI